MSAAIILIVEDEPIQRMQFFDLIEEAGFEPVEATDADMAVTILEARTDIHIVVTDIDMPGSMNGLALAEAVRSRWPPIEIIVMTAGKAPAAEALPVRCVFLPKPVKPADLIATVRAFAEAA